MTFRLHSRLEQDTVAIGDWPLCRILLMNDTRFPWLILVPRAELAREITDLSTPERMQLMQEICLTSSVLEEETGAEKMNIAALGNQVPQLHIHVIARFENDPAWPNPVWGISQPPRGLFTASELEGKALRYRKLLSVAAQEQ